ncbi:phosphoribosylanthranilate isomerase [Rariglobus hedericola]|uniref:N-(5'-phosphoribosyl)anthranilate isomerase n=1 Tax=Rariglobus hedericola TaxID=2597822 RepID=A0A556QMZ9_9BACT|nr:phosphoribosylanthranilate isomerase [Rariglobus hedericola]TSJ78015.1 phosphoribosylanthranilate isomerase [Rariglobus hedericola]
MIGNTYLKVCGQTRLEDAQVAADLGADYLGFILYPKSPRYLSLERYKEIAPTLPAGPRRVAVMVEPSLEALGEAIAAGFDLFQIHFSHTTSLETVRAWSGSVGAHRLWLAPKLPPGEDVPADWLPLAATFLLDTFHAGGFGGSGKTGDWGKFARHQQTYPQHTWILAGGLNPDNLTDAITASGARTVDVNSGVETSPGVKDHTKLKQLGDVLAKIG